MGADLLSSRAIIGSFYEQLEGRRSTGWVDQIGMRFSSDQSSETYNWLGMTPTMREWIGERQAKGFSSNGIEITNRQFEATIDFKLQELRRDKTGQVMVRIGDLAARAQTHWASLLTTLIENGESTTCYDGQFFFDTDHPNAIGAGGSSTFSNDLGTGVFDVASATAPTAAELVNCITTMITQMFTFKDEQGEPVNEDASSFLVMVPTPFWPAAMQAVRANTLSDAVASNAVAADNKLKFTGLNIEVRANPRLTWTDKLAVFRTDGRTKPFILQQETGTDVVLKVIGAGSELEMNEDKHRYGIDTWRNVGYGMWHHAVLATLT